MAVKGSKQYRTVVVAYRPVRRALMVALGTLLVAGLCALCLWLGYREAQRYQKVALAEWAALKERAEEQDRTIQQLTADASTAQISSSVDKQALEALREEIVSLNQKIANLQESNDFYRKLMEPKELTKGLSIGSFTLTPTPQSGEYHYQLVIQQFAKDPRTISGRTNVTLVGVLEGAAKSYNLNEVSSDIDDVDIPFKFRFYQSVEGNLVLPEGFTLQRIDVLAEKSGSSTPIVRSFDWQDNVHQAH